MPAEPPSEGDQPKPNPFSFSSGQPTTFGAPARTLPLFSLKPAASLPSGSSLPATAAAACIPATSSSTTPAGPLLVLDVRRPGASSPDRIEVPAAASVGDLADAVRAKSGTSGPITLLFAGAKLTCPTEALGALGIRTGHMLHAVPCASPVTGPLGRSLTAGLASPASSSAPLSLPAPSNATASSGGAAPPPTDTGAGGKIRIRFVTTRTLELPFTPEMSVTSLKRALEAKGEGRPEALRLFCFGRELIDTLSLGQQRVTNGAVIDLQRRDLAPSSVSSFGPHSFGAGATSSAAALLPSHKPTTASGQREGRFIGLRNQGATCYLNSLVQALYMTPPFRAAIESLGASSIQLPPLTAAVVGLFASLSHASSAVSTEPLTSALKWGSVSRQQDVHEFWALVCERLEEDLKPTEHAKMVEGLFQGECRDYVTCSECGTTSYRVDCFRDLKLVVPSAAPATAASGGGSPAAEGGGGGGVSDVMWSLQQMLAPEQMVGAEQYECDCCRRKTDATRGVQLTRLPSVLTLQLKRFGYDFRTGQRHKVNTQLAFDTTLDLSSLLTRVQPQPEGAPAVAAAATTTTATTTTTTATTTTATAAASDTCEAAQMAPADPSPVGGPAAALGVAPEAPTTYGDDGLEPMSLSRYLGHMPPTIAAAVTAATTPYSTWTEQTTPRTGGGDASMAAGAAMDVGIDGAVELTAEAGTRGTGDVEMTDAAGTEDEGAAPPPTPPMHVRHAVAPGVTDPGVAPGVAEPASARAELAVPASSESATYELYAVLVHSGSASFGHYYALIKDLAHGEWHEFNDSLVKPIKESELQRAWGAAAASGSSWGNSSSAYMLLYRKKDADDDGAPRGTASLYETGSGGLAGGKSFPAGAGHRLGDGSGGDGGTPSESKRLRLTAPHPAHGRVGESRSDESAGNTATGGGFAQQQQQDDDDDSFNPYTMYG